MHEPPGVEASSDWCWLTYFHKTDIFKNASVLIEMLQKSLDHGVQADGFIGFEADLTEKEMISILNLSYIVILFK